MADINVRRGGPSIWPWVLGLLVLALLIWVLAEVFGGDGAPDERTGSAADSALIDTVSATGTSGP